MSIIVIHTRGGNYFSHIWFLNILKRVSVDELIVIELLEKVDTLLVMRLGDDDNS